MITQALLCRRPPRLCPPGLRPRLLRLSSGLASGCGCVGNGTSSRNSITSMISSFGSKGRGNGSPRDSKKPAEWSRGDLSGRGGGAQEASTLGPSGKRYFCSPCCAHGSSASQEASSRGLRTSSGTLPWDEEEETGGGGKRAARVGTPAELGVAIKERPPRRLEGMVFVPGFPVGAPW